MSSMPQPDTSPPAQQGTDTNLEFIDLLLARMELLMELRTYQRYGSPEEGDFEQVMEPMRQQIRSIDQRMRALRLEGRAASRPLPFDLLVARFRLDPVEEQILMLSLAPMIDASFRKRIARFKDNILLDYCDVDLCQSVLFDSRRERLAAMRYFGEAGRLVRYRVLKPGLPRDATSDHLVGYELRVPGRVVNFVMGLGDIDPSLAPYARLEWHAVPMEHVVLPESTVREVLNLADQYAGRLRRHAITSACGETSKGAILQFVGPSGTGKTLFARAVAHYLGCRTLEVDCGKLGGDEPRFKTLLEDLFWQARMAGAVLVMDQVEAILSEGNSRLETVFGELEHWDGLGIFCIRDAKKIDPAVERWVIYQFEIEPPDEEDRRKLWTLHLPEAPGLADEVDVEELASKFDINGNQIRNASLVAANMALSREGGPQEINNEMLERAAHTQMRASMSEYARKSKIRLTLSDLILPDEEKAEIQSIMDAAKAKTFVMSKWGFGKKLSTGKGLVIMFTGEPGTGKTLCAEIMAKTLGLELYQIAIPQVMSKYIGETEKNIAQIFSTAKANHAMLLFDEADSLFGSRVKVESSVDKFSNMETNLLLQEIERFEGIIILTTNLDKQIDKAFERRIQFKVRFPFPEAEGRAKIWKLLFPKECPQDKRLDWDLLGRSFEISGGHIKNAVLRSAYRAACTGGVVTMETIRFAAEQECKQAGKLFRSFKLDAEWQDELYDDY